VAISLADACGGGLLSSIGPSRGVSVLWHWRDKGQNFMVSTFTVLLVGASLLGEWELLPDRSALPPQVKLTSLHVDTPSHWGKN
jgi:hypothetical protein